MEAPAKDKRIRATSAGRKGSLVPRKSQTRGTPKGRPPGVRHTQTANENGVSHSTDNTKRRGRGLAPPTR